MIKQDPVQPFASSNPIFPNFQSLDHTISISTTATHALGKCPLFLWHSSTYSHLLV